MEAESRSGQAAPRPLKIAAAMLAVLVGLLAVLRRLNFDESLALRSGWLLVQDVSASPPFCMPFTVALGALATGVQDPGLVFLVARVATVTATLAVLRWCVLRVLGKNSYGLACLALILSSGLFATHAVEFRYDAVVLIGWLILGGIVVGEASRRVDPWLLGVVIGVLAMHHLKGLYYAGGGYLFACLYLWLGGIRRSRKLLQLHVAIAGTVGGWFLLLVVTGFGDDFWALYRTFLAAASQAIGAGSQLTLLAEALAVDLAWWLLALTGGVWTIRARLGPWNRTAWLLAFSALPISFSFLHPMPWAYMIVPAIPFLGMVTTQGLGDAVQRFGLWRSTAPALMFTALQAVLLGTHPWSAYVDGFRAPRTAQVAALRYLRAEADPEESVLDPSGLAYFLPPSSDEWYTDGLFVESQRAGRWMGTDQVSRMMEADWVVYTYRLELLPEPVTRGVDNTFTPEWQGIGRRTDHATPGTATSPEIPRLLLQSFWARAVGR